MTTITEANPGLRVREGIQLTGAAGGLRADVIRHDVTEITIAPGGFLNAVRELAETGAFFVIDSNVHAAWRDGLRDVVATGRCHLLEPGESSKSLAKVGEVVSALAAAGAHRRASVVAVGGGVTTDLGGLVAALYFRGVPAVYVPTSLLAMIDAAIGGKTGVNHPFQKNLLGTFTHPAQVRIHLDVLTTLPAAERISAYGEALKLAIIGDPDLFGLLRGGLGEPPDPGLLHEVVTICVARKLQLLGGNCFERSLERALNLGHTVAHPLEDITGFRIRHGTAVGIGCAVAAHISHRRGILSSDDQTAITSAMQALGLPLMDPAFDVHALADRVGRLLLQRGGDSLHYVLPAAIGKVTFADHVHRQEILTAVTDLRAQQAILDRSRS